MKTPRSVRVSFVSAALHGAAVLLLVLLAAKAPRPVAARMPGTAAGKRLMLTYSLGGQPARDGSAQETVKPAASFSEADAAMHAPKSAGQRATDAGSGTSGPSALGDGNINIAALKVHPRPQPDLSDLKSGGGNVVLDVVIDEQGNISDLKLVAGLSDRINETVLATVRGWTFEPATRDGHPVASEQEIVLHYERG